MNTPLIYLLSVIYFVTLHSACFSQSNFKNAISPEELEVRNTIKQWNEAFERNDPAAYFQFIHDDLTLFIPSSPYRVEGKKDDQQEFEYSLKKGWTKIGYFQELQLDVKVYGNTAVATYHNRGTYGDGVNEKTIYLKETDVLVKESGKWKIIHIHVSTTN
jgi:ketosteroid isomerase-like protein